MTTMITLCRETRGAHARPVLLTSAVCTYADSVSSFGELSNLLQVAASVLHLIDRQLGEDFRPLVHAGLSAITAAGDLLYAPAIPAPSYFALEA